MNSPGPARKRYGQHFLHDGNIIRKILAAVQPRPGERVVEIGPGRGAITAPLLAAGARVDAIEIDRDLAAALPALPGSDALTVHPGDALRFDYRALAAGEPLRLVGNLPYNISTPLLFHLLAQGPVFRDLHVMLQKEVGERIVAAPGSGTYGRLTVALAVRCHCERLFAIHPGSFSPPPRVESVFLRLVPHASPLADAATLAAVDQLIARAFTLRRKRLSNALKGLADAADLAAAGLDPGSRPEQLAPGDWLALAAHLGPRLAALAKAPRAPTE